MAGFVLRSENKRFIEHWLCDNKEQQLYIFSSNKNTQSSLWNRMAMPDMRFHTKTWTLDLKHTIHHYVHHHNDSPNKIIVIDGESMPLIDENDTMELIGWLPQLAATVVVIVPNDSVRDALPKSLIQGCEREMMTEDELILHVSRQ